MDLILEKIDNKDLRPIREIVLERLRDIIISQELRPGDRLIENDIAEKMGVSRTPVREAFRQLENEGLAENIPRKGAIVRGLSKKSVMELYEIKEVLEGLAVRLACINMSEEHLAELKTVLKSMQQCMNDTDPATYWKLHERFNSIIVTTSDNARLMDQMKQIYVYLSKFRRVTNVMERRREQAMEEHYAIVEALEKKDEFVAEKIGREHAVRGRDFLISQMGTQ